LIALLGACHYKTITGQFSYGGKLPVFTPPCTDLIAFAWHR
jgi:hypothetical protein